MREQKTMNLAEVEFLAEHSMVSVLPNFKENKFNILTGDFGPFNPGLPVEVPIWMAIDLKLRNKCRINPPAWLDVDKLQEFKENESNELVFTEPPSKHYMEISSMLLRTAPEDIPKADEVRRLIKDIWDVRMAKLRKSVDQMILSQETHAEINNLTWMEMSQVRNLLLPALNEMFNMRCYVAQLPAPGGV
ncbi:DNA replication complex GINS protein PSF2 [Hydra vulgaris]|uniref:DNA replication complex GINS protein PSF2 n=1 Tax=Hydra vulgaris TaxID=6087 RepID=A0ABM4DK02_HYDVU